MEFVLGGLVVLVALAIYKYGQRIYSWWLNRSVKTPEVEYEPCCECGTELFDEEEAVMSHQVAHRVVERPGDDIEGELERQGSGTAFIADFCPEHCPGGCKLGCEVTA